MAESTQMRRRRGRPRSSPGGAGEARVQALDRGLRLLELLARDGSATLTDLALGAGMPASTAHRLLVTLQAHGLAEFDDTAQEWSVGIGAFRVGSAYLLRTNLVEGSRRSLRELMLETGETANLAIVEDACIVYVSQVETQNPIRAFFRPGTRSEMHASGIGKAILAHMARRDAERILRKAGLARFTPRTLTTAERLFADLSRTARRGWALDDEEHYCGMRCVAAPVFNAFGEAFAGISVSGPAVRFSDRDVERIGRAVRRTADMITGLVGGRIPEPVGDRPPMG